MWLEFLVVLGLVAVPTFSLLTLFWVISCFADVNLLQVVVSGLVCIWVCVRCCKFGCATCCICAACVVLALGLDTVPTFCLLASLFPDIMSR